MRSRLLPAPVLSACLFAAWLMLNGSVSAGHLLLAALFALTVPLATLALRPGRPRGRRFATLLRLLLVVLMDIVLANIELARRVLGPEHALQPRFVWVALDIDNPHGVFALMAIVSVTPGTLSAELGDDGRRLLVHAFSADDEAALAATIKARYEAPLREIFECS